MTAKVFIEPLDLSAFGGPTPTDSPGFTQLVQDVLGAGASEMDGFDAALADATALVEALDKITGEQDAALDAILVSLDTTKPDALDTSMAGYASTAADSANVITAGQALTLPTLLELPISMDFGGGPVGPPAQITLDLGTVALGSPTIRHVLGTFFADKHGVHGLLSAELHLGNPPVFSIEYVDRSKKDEVVRGTYTLVVQPVIVGTFVAQVNLHDTNKYGFAILTISLIVVP